MNLNFFCILANAYIDNYKREIEIDNMLNPFGISLIDEKNPLVEGVEKIFDDIDPMLASDLLDIAEYGYVEINNRKISNVKDLYSVYF